MQQAQQQAQKAEQQPQVNFSFQKCLWVSKLRGIYIYGFLHAAELGESHGVFLGSPIRRTRKSTLSSNGEVWWPSLPFLMQFGGYILDKRRLSQIILYGSLVAIQRIVMDIFGTNLALW